jgi:plasmid stabilization system protein ParE
MQFNVLLKPEAYYDIDEIIAWYEEKKKGLGVDFIVSLDGLLRNLKSNPKLFPKVYLDYHRAFLTRFPYAVFYAVDFSQRVVSVYAVLHTSRNPDLILKRIK